MFRTFGAQELLIILLIVVLLFGAKKLPETARGLGRSLRIFKAETKGLTDDDTPQESDARTPAQQAAPAQAAPQQLTQQPSSAPLPPAQDASVAPAPTNADERS
jgi:sec-independent protein translocase protein TatA